jgi:hypothetical protein
MLALTIEEVPVGTPISGDYCLFSWNVNASKSIGAGTAQYWRSDGGGMQAGTAYAAECHNQA